MTRGRKLTGRWPLAIALVLPLLATGGCGGDGGSESHTIVEQSATVGATDAVVGDLEVDGVRVAVPASAVEQQSTLSLRTAESAPDADNEVGSLIGDPFEIDIDTAVKRFDDPVTATFQLTDQEWESVSSPADLQVAYYDGITWEYLPPTAIDVDQHTITFDTYHLSLLSKAEPTEEEIRRQVAHDIAVVDVSVDKNAALRSTTESLVKSVMGENIDTSLLRDIVEGMLDQNDYTQMLKAAANGNGAEFETQFIASYTQVTANTLYKYSADFAGNLGDLGASLGLVGAFGSSTSFIADGDYQAAAEELAKGIIQTNPLGKMLLTAVKVTDRQIARWKNAEIEAAYAIFVHGKEPTIPFWGYGSIEAGDFEQLWTEMRGVGRQIVIDAVADFTEAEGRAPSDSERAQLEADAKATLRSEFEERQAREADITKAEKRNLDFLKIAEDGNLLTWSRYGFERDSMSYKDRVRQILDLRNRVLSDTKRRMNFGGEDTDSEINAYTVSGLITTFVRDGEEAYREALAEQGLIEAFNLSNAVGTHTGTLTFSPGATTFVDVISINTITNNVQFHDTPITVTVNADKTISLSYTVNTEATRDVVADYPTGFTATHTEANTYVIDESFEGIAFDTKPDASVTIAPLQGDRYTSGTLQTFGRPGSDLDDSFSDFYTSALIDTVTVAVAGRSLVITGRTEFEYPELGLVNVPVIASFTVQIDT